MGKFSKTAHFLDQNMAITHVQQKHHEKEYS